MVSLRLRRAAGVRERLDGAVPPSALRASLADIDRLNAWFGGHAIALAELDRCLPAEGAAVPRLLDVGGANGAFARRARRWARRRQRSLRVIVVDRDAAVLSLARPRTADDPDVLFVQADATALPFREGAVAVATMALTLHHLEPDAAVAALAEMGAVATEAIVVNDLLRSWVSLALVWLATRLLRCHPISRHDGPLSVRRSYSAPELRVLAEKARIDPFRIRTYPLLGRIVAVAHPRGS